MKRSIRTLAPVAAFVVTLVGSFNAYATLPQADIGARFEEAQVEGTFVLLDGQSGEYRRYNEARAARRFLPASTYKIPNTLIALESGVAADKDFTIAWDSERVPRQAWWPAAWAQDNTLTTALQNSTVWYYQELARRIGAQRMQEYIDRFNYGNRNITGDIDSFWLRGQLKISADEQVHFLRDFYTQRLGISPGTTQTVKDILVLEETSQYRLSGKTGWAGMGEKDQLQTGWLVGYLEREGEVFFFALNIDIQRNEDAAARMKITQDVLRDFGLLQATGEP